MKKKIIVENRCHLRNVIIDEVKKNGNKCDLNHIDLSKLISLAHIFQDIDFDGDISKWNVSHILDMTRMFKRSNFTGNISKWDTSKVGCMESMFYFSKFNGDISHWNVSNVIDMDHMFSNSRFKGNNAAWKTHRDVSIYKIYNNCSAPIPYWADEAPIIRQKFRYLNQLHNNLDKELPKNHISSKKMKI